MGTAAVARPVKPESEEERPAARQERELRDAVDRVLRNYGTDLNAFYRDAHRESRKNLEKRVK